MRGKLRADWFLETAQPFMARRGRTGTKKSRSGTAEILSSLPGL